jgi:hypothetical protein
MNERNLYLSMADNIFDAIQLRNPDYPVDVMRGLLDAFSDIDPNSDNYLEQAATRIAPIVGSTDPDDLTLPSLGSILEDLRTVNPDLPTVKVVSRSEMEQESMKRSAQIFLHWAQLNSILQQYEDIIRKRWIKKSKEQRKKLLLAAWPSMSLTPPRFSSAISRDRRTVSNRNKVPGRVSLSVHQFRRFVQGQEPSPHVSIQGTQSPSRLFIPRLDHAASYQRPCDKRRASRQIFNGFEWRNGRDVRSFTLL